MTAVENAADQLDVECLHFISVGLQMAFEHHPSVTPSSEGPAPTAGKGMYGRRPGRRSSFNRISVDRGSNVAHRLLSVDDERARSSDIYRLSVVLNRRALALLDAADKDQISLSMDDLGKICFYPKYA